MVSNDRLILLLRELDVQELDHIWEGFLKFKGSKSNYKSKSPVEKSDLIATELKSMAGHTIANVLRGGQGLSWKHILIDVCYALKPGKIFKKSDYKINDDSTEEEIETKIIEYLDESIKKMWKGMDRESK